MWQKMSNINLALLLFCFCLTSVVVKSIAADTIAVNQTIRDGETIVSGGGSFELGFFSPGNTSNRYLGIWYRNIPKDNFVWVANRGTPISNKSGVLTVDQRGIFFLYDQRNSVIWSSNTSRVLASNPVAQLLDLGNLVIRNKNDDKPENYLWQSFHHPGNTILPGQKVGYLGPGLDVYLTSWRSPDDPAQGVYTFEIYVKGLELRVNRSSALMARSGPWIGVGFSGVPFMKPDPIYNYSFVHNENQTYYSYSLFDTSVVTKVILNEKGLTQRFTWIDRINDWSLYSQNPSDNCDYYALCGPYGSCTIGNSPICGCFNGFVPKVQQAWERADWSGGCVRNTPLDCKSGDGFVKHSNVRLPDTNNSWVNASMSLEECRNKCLNDCSCMAYTNSDLRGSGSGCMLWLGDLLDIKQYAGDAQLFIIF